MIFHCGHCRSPRTDALLDSYQCADCGGRTKSDGTPVATGRSTDVVTNDLEVTDEG